MNDEDRKPDESEPKPTRPTAHPGVPRDASPATHEAGQSASGPDHGGTARPATSEAKLADDTKPAQTDSKPNAQADPAAQPAAKPAPGAKPASVAAGSADPVAQPAAKPAPAVAGSADAAGAKPAAAAATAPGAPKPKPAPAKPAGTVARPAGAKPAKAPPPPDPRVEAAKAAADKVRAAIEAHFATNPNAPKAIGSAPAAAGADGAQSAGASAPAAPSATANEADKSAAAPAAAPSAAPAVAPSAVPSAPAAAPSAPPSAPAADTAAQPPQPQPQGVVVEIGASKYTPVIVIRPDRWRDAFDFLRTDDRWKVNYVNCMAGTDYPDKGYIEVVLYVTSTSLGHSLCLKTRADRANPVLPSLVPVYPGANWEEREIYDLLGVTFADHPDLRRIMMWDEYKGHPLRKDFNEWDAEGEDADGSSQ